MYIYLLILCLWKHVEALNNRIYVNQIIDSSASSSQLQRFQQINRLRKKENIRNNRNIRLHASIDSVSKLKYTEEINNIPATTTTTTTSTEDNKEENFFNDRNTVRTFRIPFPISPTEPFGKPVKTLRETCHEVLELLDDSISDPPQHFRLTYLVGMLENSFKPIQTVEFFNYANDGEWELMYSNILTPRRENDLGLIITQKLNSNPIHPSKGILENCIKYKYEKVTNFEGILAVNIDYEMNSKGGLDLTLNEHVMTPHSKTTADEAQNIISHIQKSVPFDIFDPDASSLYTTYLDSRMRIIRIVGPKFNNCFSVFLRRNDDVKNNMTSSSASSKTTTTGKE